MFSLTILSGLWPGIGYHVSARECSKQNGIIVKNENFYKHPILYKLLDLNSILHIFE